MKLQDLGVMDVGTEPREILGDKVPFFFYRYLTLFAVADAMGAQARDALTAAGRKAGMQLGREMHYSRFRQWIEHFRDNGMGLLKVEEETKDLIRFRLDECATCSGLPKVDQTLCCFEAGILASAAQVCSKDSGPPWDVEEVECFGLGHTACVFEVRRPS